MTAKDIQIKVDIVILPAADVSVVVDAVDLLLLGVGCDKEDNDDDLVLFLTLVDLLEKLKAVGGLSSKGDSIHSVLEANMSNIMISSSTNEGYLLIYFIIILYANMYSTEPFSSPLVVVVGFSY